MSSHSAKSACIVKENWYEEWIRVGIGKEGWGAVIKLSSPEKMQKSMRDSQNKINSIRDEHDYINY